MLVLAATSPQPVLVIGFALAGLFLSVFYVAPPFLVSSSTGWAR